MVNQSQFIEMFGGSDYPKQPLGNLCKILVGKTLPLDVENEGGPIAYIKVADMNLPENDRVVTTSTRSVTEETAKISGILPIGATVFPKNGAAALHNKKRITAITTCVDMNTMGVYSTSDLLDPEFLYAFLVHQDVASLTLTGAIPQIRPKDIAALEIPLPPLERQRRYIGMVGQADKSKFAGFKSQFISQFGDCRIPKVELSSLCTEFLDGDWIESKDQSDSGYRLVQTGNVGNGEYIDKAGRARFVSDDTFKRLNCTEIHPGDILFSRLQEPLGRCCILPEGFPKAITAVDCTIARLGEKCFPEFLVVYTSTELYSAQVNKCVTGTTRQRISRNNLAKILVPCPDIKEQQLFVQFAQHADKSKYLN